MKYLHLPNFFAKVVVKMVFPNLILWVVIKFLLILLYVS